jgi:fumarate reductase subunit C
MKTIICIFLSIMITCPCFASLSSAVSATNNLQLYVWGLQDENAMLYQAKTYYSNQYITTFIILSNERVDHARELNRTRWTAAGIATAILVTFLIGWFGGAGTERE